MQPDNERRRDSCYSQEKLTIGCYFVPVLDIFKEDIISFSRTGLPITLKRINYYCEKSSLKIFLLLTNFIGSIFPPLWSTDLALVRAQLL